MTTSTFFRFLALSLLLGSAIIAFASEKQKSTDPHSGDLGRIQVGIRLLDSGPFRNLKPDNISARLVELFNLSTYDDSFELVSSQADFGKTLKFQQIHRGVKVEFGTVIIRYDSIGNPTGASASVVEDLPYINKALIQSDEAVLIAMEHLGAAAYLFQDAAFMNQGGFDSSMVQPSAELVYAPNNYWSRSGKEYSLAYKLDLYTRDRNIPSHRLYVDAITGQILWKYQISLSCQSSTAPTVFNGNRTIRAQQVGSSYHLHDQCNATQMLVYNCNGGSEVMNPYSNSTNNWSNSQWSSGTQVNFGIRAIYDYYLNVHGRNSWNGTGGNLIVYNNAYLGTNNAYWNNVPNAITICAGSSSSNSDDWGTIDILAHEFTHGVTQASAGLIYANESGALNEHFSDIFGEFAESNILGSNDWVMGADRGSPFRSLSNPPQHGNPNTFQGTNWDFSSTPSVHRNSGPANYMAYLLSVGGSGTNSNGFQYNITGIGITKARRIIYRCLTSYLVANSTYGDYRIGMLAAAGDLYGHSSTEKATVEQAFCAIGMGNNCTPSTPPCVVQPPSIVNTSVCTSGSAQLIASGAGSNENYRWYPSPTSTSPVASGSAFTTPTITATTNWYVSIYKTNQTGCESSRTIATLYVYPSPTIVVQVLPGTTVSAGNTIQMTASGASNLVWTGPVSVVNGVPFTATLQAAGVYTVTGNNSYYCPGAAYMSINVTPNTGPTITATATPATSSVCQHSTVQALSFSCSATGGTAPYTYGYTINNGPVQMTNPAMGPIQVNLPLALNSTAGNVTVSLVSVTDASNQVVNLTLSPLQFQVTANPQVQVTAIPDSSVCAGDSIRFIHPSLSNVMWTGPTAVNTPFFVPQSGLYQLTGITPSGCTTTGSVQVQVKPLPNLVVTATPSNLTVLNGQQVTLCCSGAISYQWTPSFIINCTPFNPAFNTTTTHTVTGIDQNGCSNTASVVVTSQDLSGDVQINVPDICQYQPANFTLSGSGGALPYEFKYSINGGSNQTLLSSTPTATVSLSTSWPGSSTVLLKSIKEGNGFTKVLNISDSINIYPSPYIQAYVSPNAPLCQGDTVNIHSSVLMGSGQITWTPAIQEGVSFAAMQSTDYVVTLTSADGCIHKDTATITVNPKPSVPTIFVNGDYLVSSSSSGNYWFLNYTGLSEYNQTLQTSLYGGGVYSLKVRSNAGCFSDFSAPQIILNKTLDENVFDIRVYPNPVGESPLQIEASESGHFSLYAGDGKLLGVGTFEPGITTIHLSDLPKGFYYLQLRNKDRMKTVKVIRQ